MDSLPAEPKGKSGLFLRGGNKLPTEKESVREGKRDIIQIYANETDSDSHLSFLTPRKEKESRTMKSMTTAPFWKNGTECTVKRPDDKSEYKFI